MNIDIQVVSSAKAGDTESFTLLYEQLQGELYKYALYALGNVHDAEDVVADTFIEAYRGIGKLRDESAFKSWIFKILSIKIKRKIGDIIRRKNTFDIEDFTSLAADGAGVESEVSDTVMLLGALAALSEEERMIISLATIQGYTTREVAEILGSPHGTVSSKLHRALAKMRKILEKR